MDNLNIEKGSYWVESDARFTRRLVKVLWVGPDRIGIQGVKSGKSTSAKRERFVSEARKTKYSPANNIDLSLHGIKESP
jgi:hypothetical protein